MDIQDLFDQFRKNLDLDRDDDRDDRRDRSRRGGDGGNYRHRRSGSGDDFRPNIKAGLILVGLGLLALALYTSCLLYTSPSPRDRQKSRMPSSA